MVHWQNIVASEEAPPFFSWWTDAEKERMQSLVPDSVDIGDKQYGREAALKENKLEGAVCMMNREKRDELKQTLEELEVKPPTAADAFTEPVTVSTNSKIGKV